MKYFVTFEVYASTTIEIAADSEEEARIIALDTYHCPSLCHHCARELEIHDVGEITDIQEDE